MTTKRTIFRGVAAKFSMRKTAKNIAKLPSTVSREIARNGGVANYRAADKNALHRALRLRYASL